MALFGSYLDESEGEYKGVRVLSIAGFVAFVEHWDAVVEPWKARVDRAGIPEFHMTEFEGQRGIFDKAKISTEDAMQLFRDLLSIMQKEGLRLAPFAIWTDLREWANAEEPYPEMIVRMSEIVAQSVWSSDGVVDIAYLADENIKHRKACLAGFDVVRKSDMKHAKRIASFGFGNSEKVPHLQVADLLAYEIMKHVRNQLAGRDGFRWSLLQLMKNREQIPTYRIRR
jgi:hypothetical protein